jgi:hypothetical protein
MLIYPKRRQRSDLGLDSRHSPRSARHMVSAAGQMLVNLQVTLQESRTHMTVRGSNLCSRSTCWRALLRQVAGTPVSTGQSGRKSRSSARGFSLRRRWWAWTAMQSRAPRAAGRKELRMTTRTGGFLAPQRACFTQRLPAVQLLRQIPAAGAVLKDLQGARARLRAGSSCASRRGRPRPSVPRLRASRPARRARWRGARGTTNSLVAMSRGGSRLRAAASQA